MKKVAIYGGSFSPVTNSHIAIIKKLSIMFDYVLVCPSFNHRTKDVDVSFEHRQQMLSQTHLFDYPTNVGINSSEEYNKDGSMYNLITKLRQNESISNEDEIHIAIGQDNADNINQWKHWPLLKADYSFVVFGRGENTPEDVWYKDKPHHFIEFDENISSSMFRETLNPDLIHPKVYDYIKEHNLYGIGEKAIAILDRMKIEIDGCVDHNSIQNIIDNNKIGKILGDIKHWIQADKDVMERNCRKGIQKGLYRANMLIDEYAEEFGITIE